MAMICRAIFLLFIAFMLSSCTQNVVKQKNATVSFTFKKMFYLPESAPDKFERHFPSSPLILNGVTYFKKVYPSVVIASNIKDVAFDKKLALLKDNEIGFLNSYCRAISLERHYNYILKDNEYVFAYDSSVGSIFDSRLCGKLGTVKMLSRKVIFHYPFVVFLAGKSFYVKKFNQSRIYLKGGLSQSVVAFGFYKNNVVFLDSLGRLIFLVLKQKRFVRLIKLKPLDIARIVNNYIYGIKDKKFFVYRFINGEPKELYSAIVESPCLLSFNYPAAICGDKLVIDNKTKTLNITFDKFFIDRNYLIGIKNGSVYLVDFSKKKYIKGFTMTKPKITGCLSEGVLYFKDFDGQIKRFDNGSVKSVKSIPDNCIDVKFLNGAFFYDNKTIYQFAKPVGKKDNIVMFKRVLNDSIYYFFEKTN